MVTERSALTGIAMALMLALSVVVGGMALGAAPGSDAAPGNAPTETPDDPGDPDEGADDGPDVDNFTDTSPLSGDQTDPPSLAGKLRVEDQYADNITVELVRNSSTNVTLAITGDENATNVTFYLQETAFGASQNVSNVTATLDGENLSITRTDAVGGSWIAFEVDHFSTRYVSLQAEAPNGSDDDETRGPPENETGMPSGVDNFTNTSSLRGTQTEPPSLAGKLRVESEHADNTSVELVRNSSTDFTLDINVTGNATNVTFYLQETAFGASQNVSNVTATLDGEPLAVGTTEARGSTWIAFEIDHFSTRTVSFETDGREDAGDGSDAAGPPALPGASNAPIDADNDGVYEDVNGDGDLTAGDATVLFKAIFEGDAAVTDNPAAFDVNGDGSVTAGDATVLFEQAFEQA